MPKRITFDTKCYDLAVMFLEDSYGAGRVPEETAKDLAAAVQRTIEDFIEGLEEARKPYQWEGPVGPY